MKRIAIIGGGISGLSAAHLLQEQKKFDIQLFEASSRLGGVIKTQVRDGLVLEEGPDCFLSKKPWARDLCETIGLSQELIPTRESFRRSFIYAGKKLNAVPAGFYLMAPGKISTLVRMPILSLFGKLRAALDLLIPRRKENQDESAASFMIRRLGREVFEKLGQPMIGGIYGGDPHKLSLRATVPQFEKMEKEYGSVIRGLARQQDEPHETASGPRYSLFLSLKQGIEQMIHGLVKELTSIKIFTACPINALKFQKDQKLWTLTAQDGREFTAEAVLIALPAYQAANLLKPVSLDLALELDSIPYESVATVNLLYRKSDVPESFNGVGFVVPKTEGTRLSACTYSSQKFEGRCGEDHALLRAFVGGALYREAFELDDHAMEVMAEEELKEILGIRARPLFVSVHRYVNAMPQYHVGHAQKVARIYDQLRAIPGLFLTGNAYEGIGIPDCILQAKKQAQALSAYLA